MTDRKRLGRPPIDRDDPSVYVTFKLPSKEYAALCRKAEEAKCSVPEHLRRVLTGRRYLEP